VRSQCDEAVVHALRETQLNTDVEVPEAELRAEYDRERDRYSQAAGIKVAHILMKNDVDGQKRAAALLRELTEKTKKDFYAFSDAAQVQSIDGASKLAGGELPVMSETQLQENFGLDFPARLVSLEPGALVPQVITTPRGLHLVRLVERMSDSTVPFERVRESIATRMRAERSRRAWTEFVAKLESETGFSVVP
jgi:parvulin-like peptidyl-prolyl isomerase